MSTLPTKTWSGIPGEQISNTANFLRISYYQKANRKNKSRFAISVSKRFKSKKKNKFERHCRPLEQKEVLEFFQYLFYQNSSQPLIYQSSGIYRVLKASYHLEQYISCNTPVFIICSGISVISASTHSS